MSTLLSVVGGVVGAFALLETVRYKRHLLNLKKIPNRIHVNGSRGKSSVTRLIGAALRGDERKVVVKTTGTTPRFIYPDGKEVPIFRPGKANIVEQLKVIAEAARVGADTLVIECMAITPEYIKTLEERIVKSTVGVITNVREDHLDVMGPTVYDVAVNLSLSMPKNGVVFTAEKKWFWVLEREAKRRGSEIYLVDGAEVSDEEMAPFPYIEHKDNVALALAVAKHFGVPRKVALERMYRVNPDPGVLREIVLSRDGKIIYLFNALAANDPDSAQLIWDMARRMRQADKTVVLLVLRRDRPQRTEVFTKIMGTRVIADHYVIAGTPTDYVAKHLRALGVPPDKISALEQPKPEEVAEEIFRVAGKRTLLVAMGNIVGLGGNTINALRNWEANKE